MGRNRMRQFRGIPIGKTEFIYGWYAEIGEDNDPMIYPHDKAWSGVNVIPETVGQYTGLKDKKKVDGYAGDKVSLGSDRPLYLIRWSVCNAGFELRGMDDRKERLHISNLVAGEIVGHIHEEK